MSRRCTKCGSFLTDTDRFCPGCGENAPQEVESQYVYTSTPQQTSNYAPPVQSSPAPYIPSNAPQYNPYQNQNEEMSLGKWILTIVVTGIPFFFIGIIFLFIWAFTDGPKARKNYCRAMLIVIGASIVLVILLYSVIFAAIGIGFSEFMKEYAYSSFNMAASFFGGLIS